jgi:single-strand DNA-binding protein
MPHYSNTTVLIPSATVARKPEFREVGERRQGRSELLLAVDRGYGREAETDWFQVICWGRTAENAAKYLEKGARVSISGHLRGDFYQAKDGTTKRSTEIVADSIQFLSRPRQPADGQLPTRQVAGER